MPALQPADEANAKLLANVRPPGYVNPQPAARYNLVVIGAGTAGLVTAAGAAGLGAKVALVERHLLGGDCLNVGCVPSKTMIRSARAMADVAEAGRYGVRVPTAAEADFPAVMRRVRDVRARISRHDSVARFTSLGVDVFLGPALFTGPERVEVDGCPLRFSRAVIATGTRPARLPVEGLDEAGYLTNESVFEITERPATLAVVGAGAVGCELGQAFARLGSQVTLLDIESRVLPREDPEAAARLHTALERDGVRLLLGAKILRVQRAAAGKVLHVQRDGERPIDLTVEEILVAVGRTPNIEQLGLEQAGVRYGKHGVDVNDYLQTSNRRIYAAGDVCLAEKFTHAADVSARLVIQNALFLGRKKQSALSIPRCTYTDPEIASVGLTEREAETRGLKVRTFTTEWDAVDRAVTDGDENGLTRVVVRSDSDEILGGTIVGRHAGELVSELAVAISGKMRLGQLASVIHPYPTHAESLRKTADAYNRTRLTPFVRSLFDRWLAWRR